MNDKIEKVAWNYFEENGLLKEADHESEGCPAEAYQYMCGEMLEIFRDAYELGRKSMQVKSDVEKAIEYQDQINNKLFGFFKL